jgi:predicted RNA-binding Zn ribbon-like protein
MAVAPSTHEKTAPGELELVQAFVNSVDYDHGEEDLGSPEALREWLSARELMQPDTAVSDGDLRRAIDVREGLRALLLQHNGLPLDIDAVDRLDRAASRAGIRIRFDGHGEPSLAPDAGGVDGALAQILTVVSHASVEGTWQRLKACPKESCVWAFYDRTKNRSGRWCSMEVCGNVEKARRFRARHSGH